MARGGIQRDLEAEPAPAEPGIQGGGELGNGVPEYGFVRRGYPALARGVEVVAGRIGFVAVQAAHGFRA